MAGAAAGSLWAAMNLGRVLIKRSNVCLRGQTRKHLLAQSITGFPVISSRLVARSLSHPLTDPCQFDMIAQDKKIARQATFILARAIGTPSSKQKQS
jgi:hypothetical protein